MTITFIIVIYVRSKIQMIKVLSTSLETSQFWIINVFYLNIEIPTALINLTFQIRPINGQR